MHNLFGIEFLISKLTFINNMYTDENLISLMNRDVSIFFQLKNNWNNYKLVNATKNSVSFIIMYEIFIVASSTFQLILLIK